MTPSYAVLIGLPAGIWGASYLFKGRDPRLPAGGVALVTYLMPPIALAYRALLLDEPITAGSLGGLALILLGVAVGSRPVRVAWTSRAAMQAP